MVKVRADRKQEMTHAHTVIIKLVGPATKKGFGKSVPRFLNRLLGMRVGVQNAVFSYYCAVLSGAVARLPSRN